MSAEAAGVAASSALGIGPHKICFGVFGSFSYQMQLDSHAEELCGIA